MKTAANIVLVLVVVALVVAANIAVNIWFIRRRERQR